VDVTPAQNNGFTQRNEIIDMGAGWLALSSARIFHRQTTMLFGIKSTCDNDIHYFA